MPRPFQPRFSLRARAASGSRSACWARTRTPALSAPSCSVRATGARRPSGDRRRPSFQSEPRCESATRRSSPLGLSRSTPWHRDSSSCASPAIDPRSGRRSIAWESPCSTRTSPVRSSSGTCKPGSPLGPGPRELPSAGRPLSWELLLALRRRGSKSRASPTPPGFRRPARRSSTGCCRGQSATRFPQRPRLQSNAPRKRADE